MKSRISLILLVTLLALLNARSASAGSATWNLNPISGDWNNPANWAPMTVPNGIADIATFDLSNTTNVSLSANTAVSGIVFNATAAPYTVSVSAPITLTISGTGITNNSANSQSFVADPGTIASESIVLTFENNASAGSGTIFTANGAHLRFGAGAEILFRDNSSAGTGLFLPQDGTVDGGFGGKISFEGNASAANASFVTNDHTTRAGTPLIVFLDDATAANATFTLGGSVSSLPTNLEFLDNSTADHAVITLNGGSNGGYGAVVSFTETASAGAATITAQDGATTGIGGSIYFGDDTSGGTAQVAVIGTALLYTGRHNPPGVTIGSLEGSGNVYINNTLTIGSNNLSTTMSGLLSDVGGFLLGAVAKIGTGTLTLSGANTYTQGTVISGGGLLVANTTGSATGTGAVQVNGGFLGGPGIIAGDVTIGTGSGPEAAADKKTR